MKFTLTESEELEFEAIPANEIVVATVEDVVERESIFDIDKNDPSKGKQVQVNFKFKVTEGDYQGRVLFGSTPTTFSTHPDCKLRAWVQAILGVESVPVDFEFTEQDLIGMPVKVVVGNYNKTNVDKSITVKDKVEGLLPVSELAYADDIF